MFTESYVLSQLDEQNNRLLGSLDSDIFRRLAPLLELVALTRGASICTQGRKLSHAYFPVSCVITLSNMLVNGETGESAVIGNEGMLGVPIFAGGDTMTNTASVQIGGDAYRLSCGVLIDEFNRSESMRNQLLRYTLSLFAQTSQTAVCNNHHTLQQRLCRRLLITLDRVSGTELRLTQEEIARNLGTRREGVSEAANRLQRIGLITYHRGKITVLDRDLLEEYACECYHTVKEESERLEKITAPPRKHIPYSIERRRRVRPTPPALKSVPLH